MAQETPREPALSENKEVMADDESQIFYLITTYNPKNDRKIVTDNWEVLQRSSVTKDLSEKRIIFGHGKCPNLKDILVRAKLPKASEGTPNRILPNSGKGGRNECKMRNCNHCPILNKSGTIISTYPGVTYTCKKI